MSINLEENEIIRQRKLKRDAIAQAGVYPYGGRFQIVVQFIPDTERVVAQITIIMFIFMLCQCQIQIFIDGSRGYAHPGKNQDKGLGRQPPNGFYPFPDT